MATVCEELLANEEAVHHNEEYLVGACLLERVKVFNGQIVSFHQRSETSMGIRQVDVSPLANIIQRARSFILLAGVRTPNPRV